MSLSAIPTSHPIERMDLTLAMLEPEELLPALRLAELMRQAGWGDPDEARAWKERIRVWAKFRAREPVDRRRRDRA